MLKQPPVLHEEFANKVMSWVNPPSTATGGIKLYADLSSGSIPLAPILLVDGTPAGSAGIRDPLMSGNGKIEASLETSFLSNRTHTVQLTGFTTDNKALVTPPLTLTVSNVAGDISYDVMFDTDEGEVASFKATLPADTRYWTLQVINEEDESVVREWTSLSTTVALTWDGKNGAGNFVPEGNYRAELVSFDAQGGQKKKPMPLRAQKGHPNALILINYLSASDDPANPKKWDDLMASDIEASLKVIRNNNPGFRWMILKANPNQSIDKPKEKHKRLKIRSWMVYSTTIFYLFGHGSPAFGDYGPQTSWGGILFHSKVPANDKLQTFEQRNPEFHFIIPNMTFRQYNFVWMDTCSSAGGTGTPPNDIGTPNNDWANAFLIGTNQDFTSAFMGWNGAMGFNASDNGAQANWSLWRKKFWEKVATGLMISQAAQIANQFTYPTHHSVNPYDANRLRLIEDTWLP